MYCTRVTVVICTRTSIEYVKNENARKSLLKSDDGVRVMGNAVFVLYIRTVRGSRKQLGW